MTNESVFQMTQLDYERSITFDFLPRRGLPLRKSYTAPDASAWFEYASKIGLKSIQLYCRNPISSPDIPGFANSDESSILCFFSDESSSSFAPHWEADSKQHVWDIHYSETTLGIKFSDRPRYEDNTAALRSSLIK